ncbi:Pre-mRNA-splicing factor SPF27 [Dimargaris verticillata]|uniref:Pre-mRNA-splicing factor SPF27 n=1 Tax=Dimargaris verticillata TaxID=2761393 RepID=A0A9W8B6L0_9FUNG|nr:Pre-mRNA-splicing factor SPF27 [Dimargaris verticillata]
MQPVDALPYIDQEYEDPGMKRLVDQLIEDEMQAHRFDASKHTDRLPPAAPKLFASSSPALVDALDRVSGGQKLPALDTQRYTLPVPSSDTSDDDSAVMEWAKAVANAQAQLAHQSTRVGNLELLQQHGSSAWLLVNHVLQRQQDAAQARVDALDAATLDLNKQRKLDQTMQYPRLQALEHEWMDTVSRNIQLELVCKQMETELAQMAAYESELQQQQVALNQGNTNGAQNGSAV